jgi:Protein of unknown function (DUF1579)
MSNNQPQMPLPDPALEKLEPLVGGWELKGRLTGSSEENITGKATFEWLPGGYFLQQTLELDFMGMPIKSREIISYSPGTKLFSSLVYSNMSPVPLPYTWDVQDGNLTISVKYGALDATFTGRIGDGFTGAWRPNPGADPQVNVAYELTGERVE